MSDNIYRNLGSRQVSWAEYYSVEDGRFQQFVADEVARFGAGRVSVEIAEAPETINPDLRRISYVMDDEGLTIRAFNAGRRVQPRSSEEPGGYCWLPGEREKAATETIKTVTGPF